MAVGLWVEPAHASPLPTASSRVAKWGNATTHVTVPYARPKDHDVNLSTFSAVPSPGARDACRL